MQTAAGCALALSLAGCGSDNPKPAPPPTKASSSSPSPTGEVAPTMPAEARGTSEEAAKAFVRHYLAALSYATRTGDVHELKTLGLKTCESCSGVMKSVVDLYAAGGSATGRGYGAGSIETGTVSEDTATIRATVIAYPQTVVASRNAAPERSQREDVPTRFDLRSASGKWVIADWTRLTR